MAVARALRSGFLDVEKGRQFLNFSRWEQYPGPRKMAYLASIAGAAANHAMPPRPYLALHQAARLSAEERQLIVRWATQEYRLMRQPEPAAGG